MTRAALLIILVSIALQTSSAQSAEQVFEQANQLYQQGKVAEARDAYESLVWNGYASTELYYNLGNAYYRLGDMGRAVLNYERAMKNTPGDEDLRHNLLLVNRVITDRIEPTPRLFVWDYWDGVKSVFSMESITWIAYAAFLLVVGSIVVVILARTYALRKVGLLSSASTMIIFMILLTIFSAKLSDVRRSDLAIITATIVTVKNSPDEKSSDAFVLHSGVKVVLTDSVGDWVKVRLADGKIGWMQRGAAEVI